jgi:hypothetical protein
MELLANILKPLPSPETLWIRRRIGNLEKKIVME